MRGELVSDGLKELPKQKLVVRISAELRCGALLECPTQLKDSLYEGLVLQDPGRAHATTGRRPPRRRLSEDTVKEVRERNQERPYGARRNYV